MKNNSIKIFGIVIACAIFLLSVGCTNQSKMVTESIEHSSTENVQPRQEAQTFDSTDQQNDINKDFVYATEIKNTKDTLTLLDHTKFDINQDGQEESIELYTAAEKDPKGKIAWDDGQRWLLRIVDGNSEYVLFDDYVQLGDLNYWLYTSEQNTVHLTTIQNCSAGFIVTDYIFDSQQKRFKRNVLVNPPNVNMLHFSHY